MLQIFLQQCSQLGTDISTVWQSYGGQYLAGMGATLRLALLATLIGCIIGFFLRYPEYHSPFQKRQHC